jgi:hypothetical protein
MHGSHEAAALCSQPPLCAPELLGLGPSPAAVPVEQLLAGGLAHEGWRALLHSAPGAAHSPGLLAPCSASRMAGTASMGPERVLAAAAALLIG